MNESIIRTYYENLAAGLLIGKKCRACDCITFPPTALCEKCGKPDLEDVTLSGEGEVLFISHSMAPPPNPRFNDLAPYAYGHVRLAEGVFVQGIVADVGVEPVEMAALYERCPLPVRARILTVEDLPILAFDLV
jgi:uncharacterized protein